MRKSPAPGCVFLNAVDEALAIDVGGYAVEDEVADGVGIKVQLAVAVEIGKLVVEVAGRPLVSDDVELVELVLMLVELCRVEIRDAERREVWALPRIVRNLKSGVRHAAHEGQAAGRIEHCGKVEKPLFLRRAIMNRLSRGSRIFDPEVVLQKAP